MAMRLAIVGAVALAGVAASTRGQPPPVRARAVPVVPAVPGCYALFDSAGRPAPASLYWAPATARLAPGGRAAKLTPTPDAGRPSGPGAYRWTGGGRGDSLRLWFHNGYSGTEFVLGWVGRGDTLRGRAREHWDAGPPFETAAGTATAVRIPCPGTGPAPGRRHP